MNMEIQKKWFIYINDQHQGPFSVDEVQQKLTSGQITQQNHVWCEGMSDWQVITQVASLMLELSRTQQDALEKITAASTATTSISNKTVHHKTVGKASEKKKPAQRKFNLGKIIGITSSSIIGLFLIFILTLSAISHLASDSLHASIRPTLISIIDRMPFLSELFRLVPHLNDVKPDDQKELEAAQTGLPENGVKLAIALSSNDPIRPFFYISTNLPNATKLDVYVVGNSETLLNRLQFSTQLSTTALRGFAKTEVVLSDGGQPVPKGEYQIFVTESPEQEPAITTLMNQYTPVKPAAIPIPSIIPTGVHFLFSKTVFMGGERDDTYLTRLKAFHEKVKQNAEKELSELQQYTSTLNLQFTTLTTEFGKIYRAKKITPAQKAAWSHATESWQQINGQLEQTIQTWSKETLQNEYFYGKAYELVKSCFDSLKTLFTLENNFIDQPQDKPAFEIQHGKALSESREATEVLQGKVDLLTKAPKTPSGLPTREGL